MLSINTNLSSLIAQNSMKESTNKLNQAIERMTTGAKINHAKDNAANYSISTDMSTKISAYNVAEDNASMGLDMLTTASDTISEMQNHAERLRALTTQARNGTYGGKSLEAIQAEANAIYAEINRLYSTAKYNGISLFNQSEYDIPDYMPKADPITGFIEDPYDYSEEDLKNITSISKVTNTFTENEYKIETVDDLAKLAKLTNDGVDTTGKTFILANDLDLKEYCEEHKDEGGWTPIGNEIEAYKFQGTFNGNGNVISNLTINRLTDDYQGLFGYTRVGQIKNLGMVSCDIKAKQRAGCVVGYSVSTVSNCFATGIVNAKERLGGLAGRLQGATTNCYFKGEVLGDSYVGGLAGTGSKVSNCYAMAVTTGLDHVGGLLGESYSLVDNCYSVGEVIGIKLVGGLIGKVYAPTNSSKIKNSISYTNVTGEDIETTGNLVGAAHLTDSEAQFGSLEITKCSAAQQNIKLVGCVCKLGAIVIDYDMSMMLAGIEEIQLRDISTNLQVGIKDKLSSKLKMNTNFELDLGKVVRFGIDSDYALNAIDDFVNLLSEKQTELGAVQNRLFSALDEISTQRENLISSRSTLRDADIAEVSSQYIQQQILQQASATLMATANQSPAIALQLI